MALKLEESLQALQSRLSDVKANVLDLRHLVQTVQAKVQESRSEDPERPGTRSDRLVHLARQLASPAGQPRAPDACSEVPARLGLSEVAKLFLDGVPGVQRFLCEGRRGDFSLKRLQAAYAKGFTGLASAERQLRLTRLMRLVVHHCHEGGPGSARRLRELAEAFRSSEAAQARAVEQAILQIRRAATDFSDHLARLAGGHKAAAIGALATERCAKLGCAGGEDGAERYKRRLVRDVGDALGLDQLDVEAAGLDEDALAEFSPLTSQERLETAARFRELFDVGAVIGAFVSEVKSSDSQSPRSPLASSFFSWAAERAPQGWTPEQVEARARSEMCQELGLIIFEVVFLGGPKASAPDACSGDWARSLLLASSAGGPGRASPEGGPRRGP